MKILREIALFALGIVVIWLISLFYDVYLKFDYAITKDGIQLLLVLPWSIYFLTKLKK
jgi:hypothetical protein